MNNFTTPTSEPNPKTPRHLETLTTTVFQSLFPPINPQTTPLKSIHRVLLLNREPASDEDGVFIVNFRHYAITTKSVGLSRPLRRLNAAEKLLAAKSRKGGMPNLGKLEDIADFMIGGPDGEGYMTDATSGSEIDTDAEVDVLETFSRKLPQRSRTGVPNGPTATVQEDDPADEKVERRAVKLVELGPRMRLRLTKVEDGMCSGKVMWHEYINKTKEEAQELEDRWDKRRKEKDARKKEQKANVEKKKAANAAKKKDGGKEGDAKDDDDDDEVDDQIYNASDMDWDDFDEEDDEDEDSEGM
jgi:ribosome biogenesis protein SSF1/2